MAGTVRIGIVGSGGIARAHAQAIAEIPEAKLTAVCDIAPEAAKKGSEEFKVPGFIDQNEMFKSKLIDAVTVCTPHWFHPDISVAALKAGFHVLTEKPMAVTVEGCDKMIAAAKKARKVLQVVYQMRYTPPIKKFHDLVKSGAVGEVYRVQLVSPGFRSDAYYKSAGWRGNWRGEGGGVLMNQAPHHIDAMLFVSCQDPEKILAVTETFLHPIIEVEDRASAVLWFKNGGIGYMHVSTCESPSTTRIEVAGDKGKIVYEDGKLTQYTLDMPVKQFCRSTPEMWGSPKAQGQDITPPAEEVKHTSHYNLMKDFVTCIIEKKDPVVTGEEGRRSVEIIDGAILSGKLGKPVPVPVSRPAFNKLMKKLVASSKFGKPARKKGKK